MAEPTPSDPNYGIQDVLTIDGKIYTLQASPPSDQEKSIEWTDQYDATIGSRHIDLESTCALTAIGAAVTPKPGQSCRFPLQVGSALTYRTLRWQITGIAEAGSYNALTVWTINIRRWTNWPKADSTLPDLANSNHAALPVTPVTPPAGG